MNFIVKNFFRGLAIVVPFVVTVYILYQSFIWVDRLVALPAPGLGLLATLSGIVLVGMLASNYVIHKALSLVELLFTRAPLVKIIYNAIKDLTVAFVGDRRRFDRPVLVSVGGPGSETSMLGFVTCDDLSFLGIERKVAVYFPHSYAIAGNVVLVPGDCVSTLDVDSSQLMAFIVSGGVSGGSDGRPRLGAGA